MEKGNVGKHVPWKMALIIAHVPVLAGTLVLNYMSAGFDVPGK